MKNIMVIFILLSVLSVNGQSSIKPTFSLSLSTLPSITIPSGSTSLSEPPIPSDSTTPSSATPPSSTSISTSTSSPSSITTPTPSTSFTTITSGGSTSSTATSTPTTSTGAALGNKVELSFGNGNFLQVGAIGAGAILGGLVL